MSSTVDYQRINAIGATVISCMTIIAAAYLMISLWRQGRGKLRVRLLLGMVLSDVFLGVVIMVPELSYVVGSPMQTNTPVCNAFGFLITWALFTQHLWTLAIAMATFLLLKYPLSRSTTWMDRYSYLCFPVIYGVSALHSGRMYKRINLQDLTDLPVWWRYYGFISTGNLCYYGTDNSAANPDPRDLVQFVPRAFVFIVIIILYSMLFRFLRRPDTIQLSSNMHQGNTVGTISSGPEESDDTALGEKDRQPKGVLRKVTQRLSSGRFGSDGVTRDSRSFHNNEDVPPWERMEFVHIGGTSSLAPPSHHAQSKRSGSAGQTISQGQINTRFSESFQPTISGGIILASPPQTRTHTPRMSNAATFLADSEASDGFHTQAPPPLMRSRTSSTVLFPDQGQEGQRGSDAETIVTPPMPGQELSGDAHIQRLMQGGQGMGKSEEDDGYHPNQSPHDKLNVTIQKLSDHTGSTASLDSEDSSSSGDRLGPGKGNKEAQNLTAFFQQYQITTDPGLLEGGAEAAKATGRPQMSAAAYFNRQASLLMLYFPLAYMLVFSVSLVRLIYDMTTEGPPNPILSLISAWFVVSVGLIDGLVYGLAEFMVRRRVRRKMPDRM